MMGGGSVASTAEILTEDDLVAWAARRVADGQESVIVDLGALEAASEAEVKDLTSFLWSLRVAGASPALVCTEGDVANACRSLKLDQAFPFFASGAEAESYFT